MSNEVPLDSLTAHELLSIDYHTIQDKQKLNEITDAYRIKIQQSLQYIKEYNNILSRNNHENQVISGKMRDLKDEYKQKNVRLNVELESAKEKFDETIKQVTNNHEKSLKSLQQFTAQHLQKQDQSMKNLQVTISQFKENQIEEQNFLREIQEKTKQLINSQYAHHDNMNIQSNLQVQSTHNLIHQNLDLIKELKKNAKKYAEEVVYEENELNQSKNYELKHRLMVLQEELTKLRKDRNTLVNSTKECRINISINEEQLEEYKAVGSLQKSKIKMYQDKIEYTKKNITAELGKLEKKVKDKRNKWENEMKGLKMKLYTQEKQKQELKNNLQKYKALGQTILMQREEVEEFFVVAIQECKKQIGQYGAMQENNEKQYGEKVDIDQLSPKDRHRILTNLYTKLALGPK